MPADEHEYQQQLDELRDAASRAMGHTHEVIDSLEEHTPAQASRTPNKPTGSWRPSFPLPACYRQWNGDVVVPEFLRTLVFARPRGDDQFADCTFSPSLDMSR